MHERSATRLIAVPDSSKPDWDGVNYTAWPILWQSSPPFSFGYVTKSPDWSVAKLMARLSLPDIKGKIRALNEPAEVARLLREGFSSEMKKVMQQFSRCVEAINNHDEYYDEDRHVDEFEPVPPIWVTGEEGTGKKHLADELSKKSKSRERFVQVESGFPDEQKAWAGIFDDTVVSEPDGSRHPAGKFWLADAGLLVFHAAEKIPAESLKPLLSWRRSGRMQRRGEWTRLEIVDVVIILLSKSSPHVVITDSALYQALVSRALARVSIPPLRDRPEDMLLFLQYFLRNAGRVYMGQELSCEKNFEDEALLLMVDHQWPDNVQGVKHFIDFLIFSGWLNSAGDKITAHQAEQAFKIQYGVHVRRPLPPPDPSLVRPPSQIGKRPQRPHDDELGRLYRDYIRDGGWSQAELATALGVHESALSRWLNEAGVPPRPRGRRPKSSRPKPPSHPTS